MTTPDFPPVSEPMGPVPGMTSHRPTGVITAGWQFSGSPACVVSREFLAAMHELLDQIDDANCSRKPSFWDAVEKVRQHQKSAGEKGAGRG